MILYLTADEIVFENQRIISSGGYSLVINRAGLESALSRPQTAAHYENADLIVQAALLLSGIVLNHPFMDGNKRTAMSACLTFLDINGVVVNCLPLDFANEILALVNHQIPLEDRMVRFIDWLRSHSI